MAIDGDDSSRGWNKSNRTEGIIEEDAEENMSYNLKYKWRGVNQHRVLNLRICYVMHILVGIT